MFLRPTICHLIFLILAAGHTHGEIIVDKDGRQLDVRFLSVSDNKVTFTKVDDNKKYTIPLTILDTLSQKKIREWEEGIDYSRILDCTIRRQKTDETSYKYELTFENVGFYPTKSLKCHYVIEYDIVTSVGNETKNIEQEHIFGEFQLESINTQRKKGIDTITFVTTEQKEIISELDQTGEDVEIDDEELDVEVLIREGKSTNIRGIAVWVVDNNRVVRIFRQPSGFEATHKPPQIAEDSAPAGD